MRLRENPAAYLIRCIVNEAKNVHRTRKRGLIDANVDLQDVSNPGDDLRGQKRVPPHGEEIVVDAHLRQVKYLSPYAYQDLFNWCASANPLGITRLSG